MSELAVISEAMQGWPSDRVLWGLALIAAVMLGLAVWHDRRSRP